MNLELVSSVRDIKPVDSRRPRHLNITFESNTGTAESIIEFDTDESAQDWRRELLGAFRPCVCHLLSRHHNYHQTGALFVYRRNHRMVLMHDDADDNNAVRINIPLSHVDTVEKTTMLSFARLVTVTFDPNSSNGATNGASTEQPTSDTGDVTVLDTAPDKQTLQFGILREDSTWDNVMSYINNAKSSASQSDVDWPGSRVYVDVDPQAHEKAEKSDNNLSDLVKSVSFALGLDTTKEIWSTSPLFLLSFPSSYVLFSKKGSHPSFRRELFWPRGSKHRMCWILVQIHCWWKHSLSRPVVSRQDCETP